MLKGKVDSAPEQAVAVTVAVRRVLVVDNDDMLCRQLQRLLSQRGYDASYCLSGEAALAKLRRAPCSVLVTDLRMPGMDGIELLRRVRDASSEVSVVIMTALGSVREAVEAMKLGASDYIEKPFDVDEFCVVIEKVFKERRLLDEIAQLRQELSERYQFGNMISRDPKMRKVFATIARVAATDTTVLITGETGTGKELVARAIHHNSARRDERFVAVNCGAVPDTLLESELFGHERGAFTGATSTKAGIFEAADGGTLLLDEIGNITQAMQVKLLRVLETLEYTRVGGVETRRCNVRILAATHADLHDAVDRKEFRRDLFYRINVVPIRLPPLRERATDIPLLVEHFMRKHGPKMNPQVRDISPEALRQMVRYRWPGNVRELEHVIQRSLLLTDGETVLAESLPVARDGEADDAMAIPFNEDVPLDQVKAEVIARLERSYLDAALRRCRGNVRETARRAGFSERSIYDKLKKYGLDRRAYKSGKEAR